MVYMLTTIQIDDKTLLILKKLKAELNASSYKEAIAKVAAQRTRRESIGGSLKKYYKNYSTENMVKELQKERRKSDRF